MSRTVTCLVVGLSALSVSVARAQSDGGQMTTRANEPLSLTSDEPPLTMSETSSNTATTGSGSNDFWFFGDVPPLTGTIATDRPGFSDTASLVPRGHFQFESGYTFSYDREHDRRRISHTMPEMALRTGLTDWLEFRTFWAGYSYSEILDRIKTPAGRRVNDIDHVDGGTDLNLGFKLPILKQDRWMPNLSVIPSLYVPTGSDSKSFNNVVPAIKFPWNYALTNELTIYGSILGRVPDGPDGQFFQTAATLAAGYKIMDRTTLYMEYFGVFPASRTQDCSHLLSAGPVFQLTDNLSLDMRAAVGLNEQAPDFQASIGFGFRF